MASASDLEGRSPSRAPEPRVVINRQGEELVGVVRFAGQAAFADGEWIGVELDTPDGNTDGAVNGVRYFSTRPRHGLFVRPQHARPLSPEAARNRDGRRSDLSKVGGKAGGSLKLADATEQVPDKLSQEIAALRAENEGLKAKHAELATFQQTAATLQQRCEAMQQELQQRKGAQTALIAMEAELATSSSELQFLRNEHERLNAQVLKLTAFEQAAAALQKRCTSQELEIADLLQLHMPEADEATKKEIASSRSKKAAVLQDPNLAAFRETVATLQSTATVLQDKLTQDQELAVLRESVMKLQKEKQALREQTERLPALRTLVNELRERSGVEEKQFQLLVGEVLKLQSTNQSLMGNEVRLKMALQTIEELQTKCDSYAEVQKEYFDKEKHCAALLDQLGSLRAENQSLSETAADLTPLRTAVDGYKREIASLRGTVSNLEAESKSKDKAIALLRQAQDTLQNDNKRFHAQEVDLATVRQDVEAKRKEISELRKEVERLTSVEHHLGASRVLAANLFQACDAKEKMTAQLNEELAALKKPRAE